MEASSLYSSRVVLGVECDMNIQWQLLLLLKAQYEENDREQWKLLTQWAQFSACAYCFITYYMLLACVLSVSVYMVIRVMSLYSALS